MSSRSPALTFIAVVAALLLGLALVFFLLPALFKVFGVLGKYLISGALLIFTMLGLFSCVTSRKPTNIKILWIIVMVLAPFLGPLLWFVWGRNNT